MHDIIRGLTSRHCLSIEHAVWRSLHQFTTSRIGFSDNTTKVGTGLARNGSQAQTEFGPYKHGASACPQNMMQNLCHGIDDTQLDSLLRSDRIHSEDGGKSKSSVTSTANQPHQAS